MMRNENLILFAQTSDWTQSREKEIQASSMHQDDDDASRTRSAWRGFWKPLALQIVVGVPLMTDITPKGIVDLELARTVDRTEEILNRWPSCIPAITILADYWFIATYCRLLLVLVHVRVNALAFLPHERTRFWVTNEVCRCVLFAGLADCLENLMLLLQIFFGAGNQLAAAAFWAASIKFGLLTVPLLLLAVVWFKRKCDTAKGRVRPHAH